MIARKALYHLNHSTSPGESIKLKNEGRQKTHEKRLTIPGHKGNANQNHTKIPSYPVRIAIIKNSTNNRCWRGCEGKGTLIQCWWECKLVQPLWKKIWRLLKNVNIDLPYDPAIPLLGISPKECDSGYSRGTCTPRFIAALFTIAKL
jgi:hypothetical protein